MEVFACEDHLPTTDFEGVITQVPGITVVGKNLTLVKEGIFSVVEKERYSIPPH